MTTKFYVGINQDENGGLTPVGRIVRDAWVFNILPESETCTGWNIAQMQKLYEQVFVAWEPYAHLPSRLPDELQQRHAQIYTQAIDKAKREGWDAELGDNE